MRRFIGGSLAFLVVTGTLLVLPVYAAPLPGAEPVAPSIDAVDLGSVNRPAAEAVVTADGAVVAAGPAAPVESPAPGAPVPTADVEGDVAVSGAELPEVPALTVSRSETDPFSAVGVTWARDAAVTDVVVQLRTHRVGGSWSGWTTLDAETPETGSDTLPQGEVRDGTAPYWTGDSDGVEVTVQAADGATPRGVQLELVDPGTSDADAVPGAPQITDTANAAAAMPAIFSRAQWGADESLMKWKPDYAPTIKAATVHHTADGNNYSADDVPRILRGIYAYHAVSRGWGDIGYNVLVDKYGRAWEGRAGGLASTVIGAHAGGFNSTTFGVSMLGNYDLVTPPPAMVRTVASVIAWKFSLYGVDPLGTTVLTSGGGGTSRYAAGARVTVPTIFGHRDVGATACPGRYGYAALGEIRSLVATEIGAIARQTGAPSLVSRYTNTAGAPDLTLPRGDRTDQVLVCDWDGDGKETMGVYRKGRFILFDSNDPSARPVADFGFGDAGDLALCGDWDGDGKASVGIWRAGWFHLRNSNSTGPADGVFAFGNTNAQPVVGNWDGDAYDTVGVYQNNVFFWTNSNVRPTAAGRLPLGDSSDRVVAGDWTGRGRDGVGVYRAGVTSTFYLVSDLNRGLADLVVRFGEVTDRPAVADLDGDGTTTVGVSRGY